MKNSRSNFLQYTITTVICQVSSAVSLLEWSEAEWEQTDCVGSAQPVGVVMIFEMCNIDSTIKPESEYPTV